MDKDEINTALEIARLNEELRISQERLKIVLGHVDGDIWEYVHHDKTMRRLTSYDPYIELDTENTAAGHLESPDTFVHADSIDDALEMLKELGNGAEVSARELRFVSKNGEELWFNVLFRNIFGENGLPVAAIGISENITRRRELEAHDLQQRKYIDSIVSKAIDVYEINLTRSIVERPANMPPVLPGEDLCLQLLFRGNDWAISPYDMDIVETELSRASLLNAFEEGRAQARCEYRRVMKDGNCWVSVVANLARDAKNGDVYALIYVKNIDDRKTQEHELKKKASFDSLTGFYNRETGIEKISENLKLRQLGTVSALLMLDLDNFKVLNDSAGHSTGDSFLKDMADAIRSLVRMDDVLCRVGGDEFFIYMKSVTEPLVRKRVRKICDTVKEVGGRYSAEYLSVSVGIALVDDYKHAFQEVYERADKALYEAKRSGKNGFAIYF